AINHHARKCKGHHHCTIATLIFPKSRHRANSLHSLVTPRVCLPQATINLAQSCVTAKPHSLLTQTIITIAPPCLSINH
ncbi:hypothetical protein VIGAN_10061300, partial [Vigna angularis var. angularis]